EIVVQRGFMSGPALANALAEQHGGVLKTEYGFASGLGGVAVRRAAAETGASISPLRAPDPTPLPQLRTADPLVAPSPESELGADREDPNTHSTAFEAPVEPFDPTPVQPLLRPAEPPAPVSDFQPEPGREPAPEAHRPNDRDAFQDPRAEPVAPRPPVEPLMASPWRGQQQEPELEPVQPLLRPAEPAAPPLAPEPELEPEPEPELPVAVTRTEEAPPRPDPEPARALEADVPPVREPEPALPADLVPTGQASA